MEKIKKVSQFICILVVLAALIHLGLGLFVAVNLNSDPSMLAMETESFPFKLSYTIDSSEAKQLAAVGMNAMIWLELPIQLIYLTIYWFVYRLFREYRYARIFSISATSQLRNLGMILVIWPVFSALYPPLMVVSLKLLGVLEHGEIVLGFAAHDIELIVLGTMLTVVGWVMGEAQKIKEEQELTI